MPRVEIEWSQLALDNFDELLAYWQERAPDVARRLGRAILEKVDMIGDFPQANRSVMGLSQSYREAFVEQYRILYRLSSEDRVRLISIRHTRQRPLTPEEILTLESEP